METFREKVLKLLDCGALHSAEIAKLTNKTPSQASKLLSQMESEKLVASRCDTRTREKLWFHPREIKLEDVYYALVDNTDAMQELLAERRRGNI